MKKIMICTALCSLILLGALPAAAATQAHAAAWLHDVYVDGVRAEFSNSQGRYTYLFSYNGKTYMPANTAAAWLGCQLTVNQAAGTADFSSSGTPHVPASNSTPPSEKADLDRLNRYFDRGVDIKPMTSFTVKVDGKVWTFTKDDAPFFVDGTLYLPLRSVGERMGKTVTWVPALNNEEDYTAFISLDAPVTPAQLAEMQSYLDQCFKTYGQAAAVAKELTEASALTTTQAVEKLERMVSLLKQVGTSSAPTHTFLKKYEISTIASSEISYYSINQQIQLLRSGAQSFQEAKSNYLPFTLNATLAARLRTLDNAQSALNVLAAAQEKA